MEQYELDFFMESSAKTGLNVQEIFIQAAKVLYKDFLSYSKDKKKKKDKDTNTKLLNNDSEQTKKGCCWISINIENFIPGRVYKETLTIYNTCKIPIIINLRSSDKSKLILSKSLLRIEVKDSKKVDLVIQDRINYSSKKLPTEPKKILVWVFSLKSSENICYFPIILYLIT